MQTWQDAHRATFEYLLTLLDDQAKSDFKGSFMQENIEEKNREPVMTILGLN